MALLQNVSFGNIYVIIIYEFFSYVCIIKNFSSKIVLCPFDRKSMKL